ncbi:hypothetical protein GCM10009119_31720 [Algoriphagus jejuensis]|uniref:Uncharacterized protein n=1 Tax=Algoriphagus jejuensis TaxID=419934 RepID=A0ABP3YJB1_9BACT
MDLGNIVYIVAVIAYFIYQATRKKKGPEVPDSDNSAPEEPKRGMSFEDLLKEIREAQNPKTPESRPQSRPLQPVSNPTATVARNKPISRRSVAVDADDEEAEFYEDSFAARKENPYQAYRDIHSIPSVSIPKMDYDALSKKRVNPYADLLKNPKTLKQAVVVSEILKPKYF